VVDATGHAAAGINDEGGVRVLSQGLVFLFASLFVCVFMAPAILWLAL